MGPHKRAPKPQSRAGKPCVPSEIVRLEEIQTPIRARLNRRDFSGPPVSAPTTTGSPNSVAATPSILAINTSIGRSSICGLARSSKPKRAFRIGWPTFSTARCPGFLETERALSPKQPRARPLRFRLEDWIDDHVFGFAKKEGWFCAITYYAVRDHALSASRSVLVGVHREVEEVNTSVAMSMPSVSASHGLPSQLIGPLVPALHPDELVVDGADDLAGHLVGLVAGEPGHQRRAARRVHRVRTRPRRCRPAR